MKTKRWSKRAKWLIGLGSLCLIPAGWLLASWFDGWRKKPSAPIPEGWLLTQDEIIALPEGKGVAPPMELSRLIAGFCKDGVLTIYGITSEEIHAVQLKDGRWQPAKRVARIPNDSSPAYNAAVWAIDKSLEHTAWVMESWGEKRRTHILFTSASDHKKMGTINGEKVWASNRRGCFWVLQGNRLVLYNVISGRYEERVEPPKALLSSVDFHDEDFNPRTRQVVRVVDRGRGLITSRYDIEIYRLGEFAPVRRLPFKVTLLNVQQVVFVGDNYVALTCQMPILGRKGIWLVDIHSGYSIEVAVPSSWGVVTQYIPKCQ